MSTVERVEEFVDKRRLTVHWSVVVATLVICESLVILATTLIVTDTYFRAMFSVRPSLFSGLSLGVVIAALFAAVCGQRGDYNYVNLATTSRPIERLFNSWSTTIVLVLFILFMTKSSADYSRGSLVICYFLGLVVLGLVRRTAALTCVELANEGRISAYRIMLVGTESAKQKFVLSGRLREYGIEVVGTARIADDTKPPGAAELADAVSLGRACKPDEILLCCNWTDKQHVHDWLGALLVLPTAISLGSESFEIPNPGDHAGFRNRFISIPLARKPISPWEYCLKRLFDVVAGSVCLLLLAPVLIGVAVAIRLETPGPILFRQKRYGFNRQPFYIYKFRSMYAENNNLAFRQAVASDSRITRVGRVLRKLNLDELPQLINVLRGEMSLVGPRPHPMDLDDYYTTRMMLYARRHNVLPGITGWAQVNGYRGVTNEEWKMQGRLKHDLYYLDNWSILFDIKIMILTLLTPKAYRNAG